MTDDVFNFCLSIRLCTYIYMKIYGRLVRAMYVILCTPGYWYSIGDRSKVNEWLLSVALQSSTGTSAVTDQ